MVSETITAEQPQKSVSNRTGFLMLAVLLVPMLAAYIIYKTGIGIPTATINKGVLLSPPTHISSLSATTISGAPVDWASLNGRWHFLVPIVAPCEQVCEQALYLTRQVHKRLNDKYERVSRIVLVDRGLMNDKLAAMLQAEYQGADVFLLDADQWQHWLANSNSERASFYMLDNHGFAMMFYQPQHTGNDLLTDIKRMLKLSVEK